MSERLARLLFQLPACSDDLAALMARVVEFNAGELFAMVADLRHHVSDALERKEFCIIKRKSLNFFYRIIIFWSKL